MARKILHMDLDAFYPSVEVLDDPTLSGRPVIVGGLGPRGVVASASYEARREGVHSAMPMAVARRKCPDGSFLSPRFARYREISSMVFDVYAGWSDLVEPLSLDEAFLDVSAHEEDGIELARRIKRQVLEATGLTVSAGVAGNKFLAKLASDRGKPDGLVAIASDEAAARLAPLPAARLWGVGPATAARLAEAGMHTIGDVATADPERLASLLGKHGRALAQMARGHDARPVEPPGRPRSISAETTFDRDLRTWEEVGPYVRQFVARVSGALERNRLLARTAVLKVRFSDFDTLTRSWTPGEPMAQPEELLAAARELARRVGAQPDRPMRLIGFGVTNLIDTTEGIEEPPAQRRLFDPR